MSKSFILLIILFLNSCYQSIQEASVEQVTKTWCEFICDNEINLQNETFDTLKYNPRDKKTMEIWKAFCKKTKKNGVH